MFLTFMYYPRGLEIRNSNEMYFQLIFEITCYSHSCITHEARRSETQMRCNSNLFFWRCVRMRACALLMLILPHADSSIHPLIYSACWCITHKHTTSGFDNFNCWFSVLMLIRVQRSSVGLKPHQESLWLHFATPEFLYQRSLFISAPLPSL